MSSDCKTVLALGLFDGVHLGHREVILNAVNSAGNTLTPAVFTFSSQSIKQKQGRTIEYIYTDIQKCQIISQLGIEKIVSENFENIKSLSGRDFARLILKEKLGAEKVFCGNDFKFGHCASCGVDALREFGNEFGFSVHCMDDVIRDKHRIASNDIRYLLKNGDIEKASELLGDDYFILSEIIHGNHLGRTLNFPTINQAFNDNQLVVRKGVYASLTLINGVYYKSITNVGVKPTVEKNIRPLAETHILDFSGDLYGQTVCVKLKLFLRPEMKFNSLDELKTTVFQDIENCKKYFEKGMVNNG